MAATLTECRKQDVGLVPEVPLPINRNFSRQGLRAVQGDLCDSKVHGLACVLLLLLFLLANRRQAEWPDHKAFRATQTECLVFP